MKEGQRKAKNSLYSSKMLAMSLTLFLARNELSIHFRQRDYNILCCIQQQVYQELVNDVDRLKQCLINVCSQCSGLQLIVADEVIDKWRRNFWAYSYVKRSV